MNRKTIFRSILLLVLCCSLFCGCSGKEASSTKSAKSGPVRDNTPNVLIPEASGTTTYGTDIIAIDASHLDQGYVMIQYLGDNPKVKMQLTSPNGTTYTYLLSQGGTYETFPLTGGSGAYSVKVLELVSGDMYSIAFSQDMAATIADEFTPYLYPNQYVNFVPETKAVAKSTELAEGAHSDLEVVENIYNYVIKNVAYDEAKATNVEYGYLPTVDETLDTGKGICFDYAALMATMLRSQNIPTRLEVGYAGEAHHAWISTYVDDKGWVNDIIEFDGNAWALVDPTFASNSDSDALKKFIGDGDNYVLKYSY